MNEVLRRQCARFASTLAVLAALASTGCSGSDDAPPPPPPFSFGFDAFAAVTTFAVQPVSSAPTGFAYDGTNLWTGGGGTTAGNTLHRYSATGAFQQAYAPGIDFRSVFTKQDGVGPIYAKAYNSKQLKVQTSPGVFANDVLLAGTFGVADENQMEVVFDDARDEFVSFLTSVVHRWSPTGTYLGSIPLVGYGTLNSEGNYPQYVRIAVARGVYLTYSGGVLSAWSRSGTRVDTTVLTGASTTFAAYYTFSYAQGKVWVADGNSGSWRGYDVGL